MYVYRALRKEGDKTYPVFLGDAERTITFFKTTQMRDYVIEAYLFNEELSTINQHTGPSITHISQEHWAEDLRKVLTWIHSIEDIEFIIKKRR